MNESALDGPTPPTSSSCVTATCCSLHPKLFGSAGGYRGTEGGWGGGSFLFLETGREGRDVGSFVFLRRRRC